MLSIHLVFTDTGIQYILVSDKGFMYTTKCDDVISLLDEMVSDIKDYEY